MPKNGGTRGEKRKKRRTDERTEEPTDSLPRSPAPTEAPDSLIFSPSFPLSLPSPVCLSRCRRSAGLSFSPRLRKSVFRPPSPSCFMKIRNERGTRLPGELGEGSVIILPSFPCLSLSFPPPVLSSDFLQPRTTSFRHADIL